MNSLFEADISKLRSVMYTQIFLNENLLLIQMSGVRYMNIGLI